jgi:hypothetical protein
VKRSPAGRIHIFSGAHELGAVTGRASANDTQHEASAMVKATLLTSSSHLTALSVTTENDHRWAEDDQQFIHRLTLNINGDITRLLVVVSGQQRLHRVPSDLGGVDATGADDLHRLHHLPPARIDQGSQLIRVRSP